MKQVIIYLRTSTEEQNPENQLKDCLTICENKRFIDYETLSEQQSSFKDVSRPVFESIRQSIKSKQTNVLICWDLDRLFRNRKKLIEFFQYCKTYDCKVYSFRQNWLEDINQMPSPWNETIHDLMLSVMGWLAEDESFKKSERIKNAIRKKDNQTLSYKGNIWGRKSISTFKKNKIIELNQQGKSIRVIAEELELSVGCVHKSLTNSKAQKSE
jgi:DNA invertase Pin-like site-specific DNA recombinase